MGPGKRKLEAGGGAKRSTWTREWLHNACRRCAFRLREVVSLLRKLRALLNEDDVAGCLHGEDSSLKRAGTCTNARKHVRFKHKLATRRPYGCSVKDVNQP